MSEFDECSRWPRHFPADVRLRRSLANVSNFSHLHKCHLTLQKLLSRHSENAGTGEMFFNVISSWTTMAFCKNKTTKKKKRSRNEGKVWALPVAVVNQLQAQMHICKSSTEVSSCSRRWSVNNARMWCVCVTDTTRVFPNELNTLRKSSFLKTGPL